ncbi:MAG TPA: hypothetical protein ENJ45_05645 [Phaeodactylibacter sp.]|nr:hypothetical protein [Phaeodactylibacter sp.]
MDKYTDKRGYVADDEVTLKGLILKIQEYWREVWRNWKLLFLFPIPFVIYMLYSAITSPPLYNDTLTFMVNEDEGGALGGVGAILGMVGLGGAKGGKYNLDKILELARSRRIVQAALLEKRTIDGKSDFLANHIIRIYNLHEEWEEDTTGMANFYFKHGDIASFSFLENKVLKDLYGDVVGGEDTEGLVKTGYGKDSGIMKMKLSTESEGLTIELADALYNQLSAYYIEKSIEKQLKTFQIVEAKVDSIHQLLQTKEYAMAAYEDSHRGLWTKTNKLKKEQLRKEIQVLNILYGESLKNLEIADFSLKTKTPFVQLIDAPVAPIEPLLESKILAIILGGIIGGMVAVTFILGRYIYRQTMAEG